MYPVTVYFAHRDGAPRQEYLDWQGVHKNSSMALISRFCDGREI